MTLSTFTTEDIPPVDGTENGNDDIVIQATLSTFTVTEEDFPPVDGTENGDDDIAIQATLSTFTVTEEGAIYPFPAS